MKYLLLLVLLLPITLSAQKLQKFGIDTLQTVPDGLAVNLFVPDFQMSENEKFVTNLGQGYSLLVFVRGGWSKPCNKFLTKLQDSLSVITEAGIRVVAVSPDLEGYRSSTVSKLGLKFPLMGDPKGSIAADYNGLFTMTKGFKKRLKLFKGVKTSERFGRDTETMPVTAVYLISASGKIVWRYFNLDAKGRPNVNEIVDQVRVPVRK
ncbi:MAG: redoxin domain-containing protein [Cryomorphaceae bacterium]|nr:redoxin domain-containing protein [Cryomorphaceae bacterium]